VEDPPAAWMGAKKKQAVFNELVPAWDEKIYQWLDKLYKKKKLGAIGWGNQ
jgi:hypothetical protein